MNYFTKEELEDITNSLLENPSRDTLKELKASIKTIDNIIYKTFDQYEKRKKDFQDLILISDKITLEDLMILVIKGEK